MPKTYTVTSDADAELVAQRLRARGFEFTTEPAVPAGQRFTVPHAPAVDVEEIVARAASARFE